MDADDSPPPVDLESIVSAYAPRAAVSRLLFVAEHSEDEALGLEALRSAHDLLKQGEDTRSYAAVVEKIAGRLGEAYALDDRWIKEVDVRNAKRQEILDAELNGYKTNSIKESIRVGHNDLGDFHRARGDFQSAFKCYSRARDYCTTPRHVVQMCVNIVRVGVESENFAHVASYAARAEHAAGGGGGGAAAIVHPPSAGASSSSPLAATPPHPGQQQQPHPSALDASVAASLACASGLAALESRQYATAARKFSSLGAASALDLGGEGDAFAEMLAPADVALAGALCAIAALDRAEFLRRASFDGADAAGFRACLDANPDARALVDDFRANKYRDVLERVETLRPAMRLDPHLHDHADALAASIRERAVVQYCAPYSQLDLRIMATKFGCDAEAMEREVAGLVAAEKIPARIDSRAKTLVKRKSDVRVATYHAALAAGREYRLGVKHALVRASLVANGCVIGGGGRGEDELGDETTRRLGDPMMDEEYPDDPRHHRFDARGFRGMCGGRPSYGRGGGRRDPGGGGGERGGRGGPGGFGFGAGGGSSSRGAEEWGGTGARADAMEVDEERRRGEGDR